MSKENCVYDYANKCDCSEDDRCGCTFPNNMRHNFDCPPDPVRPAAETSAFAAPRKAAAILPGNPAPDFTAEAVMPDNLFNNAFNLRTWLKGSYGLLLFYPADFTFVCPSELLAYNRFLAEFERRHFKLLGISVDSKYAHLNWKLMPTSRGGIGGINFPLVSDLNKTIAQDYGVLHPNGTAMRALFLLDQNMIIRHLTINDDKIGRDPQETLRIADALQFVETHGDVCPAGWRPGEKTLTPTLEGTAKYIREIQEKGDHHA